MKDTNATSLRSQVATLEEVEGIERKNKKIPFVRHGSSGPLENKKV